LGDEKESVLQWRRHHEGLRYGSILGRTPDHPPLGLVEDGHELIHGIDRKPPPINGDDYRMADRGLPQPGSVSIVLQTTIVL
jgi:hypothetical protein